MANRTLTFLPVKDLLLDENNPRLPTSVKRDQDEMLNYIARNTSITEIMSAIAENDYFPGEPLVVLQEKAKGPYIVVEGNRRLTALKLLLDPSKYPRNRTVQQIAEEADFQPEEVPCVLFDKRGDIINYLGYRHITGVKQWEPLAKARYIAEYYDNETNPKKDVRARYKEVAQGIGSQAPFIHRQLSALAVYNYIEEKEFFGIEGLNEESVSFSLISTAVGYDTILNFLSKDADPYANPNALNKDHVEHLARWFFEANESGETILGDSRNIKKLNHIVGSEEALKALVEGDSLDRAYGKTKGLSEDFLEVLVAADNTLSRAMSMISAVELDESHVKRIQTIAKTARSLKKLSEDESD